MRISLLKLMVLTVSCTFLFNQDGRAYDSKNTHRYINEKAVKVHSSVDTVIRETIGFEKGIFEEIKDKRIWEWIRDGGKQEDEPLWRPLRHFHDPVNAWSEAGLFSQYISAVRWAQTPGPGTSNGFYNEYSWASAREYYYQALLTGSKEKYAKTFRAIGQLMHLVSDAAVPAHVRNDAHLKLNPFGVTLYDNSDPYEKWVEDFFINANERTEASLISSDFIVDETIFTMAVSDAFAPSPISALWDHDEYQTDGSNLPGDSNTTIGLAEYTNANFWTEDTFPWKAQSGGYPHPVLEDTNYDENVWLNPEVVDAEDGEQDNRIYFSKNSGAPIDHLMAAGYWYHQLYMWNKPELKYAFLVDEECFADYAEKLIPRAVGYSAGLLDYFFRGSIELSLPAQQHHAGAYAVTTDPDQGFSHLALNAKNTSSSGETMTDGSIEVVVKYKLALDDPFQSYPVRTTEAFFYIAAPESNNIRAIPSDEYVALKFELTPALPLYATDVSVTLVYKGLLGAEADAIAVGYKDISEPTPIDIFSNLDKVCLAGGWKDAGSADAIALVDTNGNGIADRNETDVYPHDLRDIYLRISSLDDPQYPSRSEDDIYISELNAGEFIRAAYILSDDEFMVSTYSPYSVCTYPPDDHQGVTADTNMSARKSITNQEVAGTLQDCTSLGTEPPCTIRNYPTLTSFRGIEMRDAIVMIYRDQSWGHDTSCSLDVLE